MIERYLQAAAPHFNVSWRRGCALVKAFIVWVSSSSMNENTKVYELASSRTSASLIIYGNLNSGHCDVITVGACLVVGTGRWRLISARNATVGIGGCVNARAECIT